MQNNDRFVSTSTSKARFSLLILYVRFAFGGPDRAQIMEITQEAKRSADYISETEWNRSFAICSYRTAMFTGHVI